jgi:transcriptional regulator with XRE-family HTH domain
VRTSRKPSGQVGRRQSFGRQLGGALGRAGLRQTDLAKLVGTTKSSVSGWVNGRHEPPPAMVFATEEFLGLTAGTLSGAFGYLPVQADEGEAQIEVSIAWSIDIDAEAKEALIGLYRVLSNTRR